MDRSMDGWTDGWAGQFIAGWTDGRLDEPPYSVATASLKTRLLFSRARQPILSLSCYPQPKSIKPHHLQPAARASRHTGIGMFTALSMHLTASFADPAKAHSRG